MPRGWNDPRRTRTSAHELYAPPQVRLGTRTKFLSGIGNPNGVRFAATGSVYLRHDTGETWTNTSQPAPAGYLWTKLDLGGMPTPCDSLPTQIDIGDAGSPGVAAEVSRCDHTHALPAPVAPPNIAAVSSAGVSTKVAREDHTHGPVPVGISNPLIAVVALGLGTTVIGLATVTALAGRPVLCFTSVEITNNSGAMRSYTMRTRIAAANQNPVWTEIIPNGKTRVVSFHTGYTVAAGSFLFDATIVSDSAAAGQTMADRCFTAVPT